MTEEAEEVSIVLAGLTGFMTRSLRGYCFIFEINWRRRHATLTHITSLTDPISVPDVLLNKDGECFVSIKVRISLAIPYSN